MTIVHFGTNKFCAAVIFVSLYLLSGCGYQLRGSGGLPTEIKQVFLQTQSIQLHRAMAELLQANGAMQVQKKNAQIRIFVLQETQEQRVLSVDPNTGSAREFEVAFTAYYSVQDKESAPILPNGRIQIVRDYVFDADAVIGKSRELGVLQEEMRRDAALQLFNLIRALYPRAG